MFNPVTKAISEMRDINTWAEWKQIDPKSVMSVFNKEPDLLIEPMGLDITKPFEPPDTDTHEPPTMSLIPKQGERKRENRTEPF
jgi:hypothetical protein